MQGKVTYHQQPSFCGKPLCRRCREGRGHGPYWYAYQVVNGRTTRTYVGKQLPPDAQAAYDEQKASTSDETITASSLRTPPVSLQAADEHVTRGEFSEAITILDRLLVLDATNEATVYRLLVLLTQLKRRGEALRSYQRFADSLQRLRGVAPSHELQALYEAVRQGDAVTYPSALEAPLHTADSSITEISGTSPARSVYGMPEAAPIQIGRTHQTPLVGREEELQVVRTLLLATEHYTRVSSEKRKRSALPFDTKRHPHCLVLLGDAGIGKTRLAEEMSREAILRGWSVSWSRTYPQESGIPYRPWAEILRSMLNQSQTNPLAANPSHAQSLVALLPELQAFVAERSFPTSSAELEQLRLREAVRDVLIAVSEHAPLLIVLDDIQWADASSYELLGYLARHVSGYPMLFIATCREHELTEHSLQPLLDHMQREHTVKMLRVEPLTDEQISHLVSQTPHLTEPMIQHIQTQAAGNPFFAEELARLMPPAPSTLPRTIIAALDSRITRLSETCQHLLMNASVLGGSFEFSTLCAMQSASTGVPADEEDTLLDLLDEALQAGVLSEEGVGARIYYTFWHPLLVTHLYERVSATRRTRLHRRAAEVLQRLYTSQEQEIAATITHHLVQGGAPPVPIIHYAELAGHRAYALLAYPEAERHYRLAVEYMDTIGNAPVETTLPVSLPDMPTLLERLAECRGIQGNFAQARALYERSLALRHRHTSSTSTAEYQHEAQLQALLWGEIGRMWRYEGHLARALSCCERGEAVLRDAGITTGPAWATLRYQVGSFYELEGRYEVARHASQEALALFEQSPTNSTAKSSAPLTRIERTLEGDPVNLGRTYALLGMLDYNLGQLTDSLAHLNIALTLYEQYDRQREIAHVTCNIGHVYLKRGEYEPAHAALRRSLSLAERIGDGPLTSVIFMNLGELEACAGNFARAENWYRKSLTLAERFNDRQYISMWNAELASVLVAQGKLNEAAASVGKALQIGRAMQNAPCIGAALVALATLRIAQAQAVAGQRSDIRSRLLLHARSDVQRALSLERLEAETRFKGQHILTQVAQLLGDGKHQQA